MFLTATNLPHYLLARAQLDVKTIVDGHLLVMEAGRHNRNFKVLQGRGQGLFVKQIKESSAHAKACIRREAACYRLAQEQPAWAALMPRFFDYDELRHSLVMELFAQADNLREQYATSEYFSAEVGQLLGQALGCFHQCEVSASMRAEPGFLNQRTPWILVFHQKSYFPKNSLSGGAEHLGEQIRQLPQLQRHLARLRREWRFDSLVHGDIKWDNCLSFVDQEGQLSLKIIDWELLDLGDASWDVGGVFQTYLAHWIVRSVGQTARVADAEVTSAAQDLIHLAQEKMPAMFASLQAFWQHYCVTRGLVDEGGAYLIRCIEHAAARLLQTAFESLFNAATLTPQAIALIQISQEILDDPQSAAVTWFGLGKESA